MKSIRRKYSYRFDISLSQHIVIPDIFHGSINGTRVAERHEETRTMLSDSLM